MQLENSHDGVKQWASIDRRRFLALVGTGVASGGLGIPVLASAGEQARAMGTAPNGTPRLGLEMEYLFSRRTQVRREIIGPVRWDPPGTDVPVVSFDSAAATVLAHVDRFDELIWSELHWQDYPHIVLGHDDLVWTSVHLALRKPLVP